MSNVSFLSSPNNVLQSTTQSMNSQSTKTNKPLLTLVSVTCLIEALDREQLTGALDAAGIEFTLPEGTRQAEAVVHLGSDPEAAALLRQLIVAGVGVVAFAPASGILEESYLRAVNNTQDPPSPPKPAGETQP